MIESLLPARPHRYPRLAVLVAGFLSMVPLQEAGAQQWNGPRALTLVDQARTARQALTVDSALSSYQASARGFVYFFADRPDENERSLIKADQVALEVFWRAPNQTKQHIVGLRDEKVLPTNIQYHLDHLTVVQDDFSDRIRLGDGDEVSDVIHPVAPGAESRYDYRLGDSLTIAFPGSADTVRVYEVEVRPKDSGQPGFVGTVFLDRVTAAIVRMNFTFTPSSYVDPYLDYIRISLDNSLWMGRHWLPYRQEVEIRRELPILDFLAGSVIRGRFQIRDYEFNVPLADALFLTSFVSTVGEAQRRAFPFEEPLYAELDRDGLTTPPSLEQIEARAREIVQDRYLGGLARLRLHLPSASSGYRYGRAEGSFVGLGTAIRTGSSWSIRTHAGYAFGRERPAGSLALAYGPDDSPAIRLDLYGNRPVDVGPIPAAGGVINSFSALIQNEDWTDPYFASGARIQTAAFGPIEAALRWEFHREAKNVVSRVPSEDGLRPVRPIHDGHFLAAEVGARLGAGAASSSGWGGDVTATLGRIDDRTVRRFGFAGAWARTGGWRDLDLLVRLDAGWISTTGGTTPPQLLYLLGGRETVLGHPFRGAVGDKFWLLRAEGSREVVDRWLTLRAFASGARAKLGTGSTPPGWEDLDPDSGTLFGIGAGAGLFWDVIRLDVGRGLDGGDWSTALSVTRRFRAWL